MGDRVHASITFGGHIETVAEAETFIKAIDTAYITESDRDEIISGDDDAKASLRYLIENNREIRYHDNECNYGEFRELEAMVKEIPGLGCCTNFEAGGGFDAGIKTIMPDGSVHSGYYNRDGGVSIPLDELKRARHSDDALASIDKLILETEFAEGTHLPEFTVSPAVATWLKIFAAAA